MGLVLLSFTPSVVSAFVHELVPSWKNHCVHRGKLLRDRVKKIFLFMSVANFSILVLRISLSS